MKYIRNLIWNLFIIGYRVYIIFHSCKTYKWLRIWSIVKPQLITKVRTNAWRKSLGTCFMIFPLFWPRISLHLIPRVNIFKYLGWMTPSWHHSIIFEDFVPYLIYENLEIPWLRIRKSLLKHNHLCTIFLWYLKSKDHVHNYDMN